MLIFYKVKNIFSTHSARLLQGILKAICENKLAPKNGSKFKVLAILPWVKKIYISKISSIVGLEKRHLNIPRDSGNPHIGGVQQIFHQNERCFYSKAFLLL